MTTAQVQDTIAEQTGFIVTVKAGKGAMKGYTYFSINKNQKFDFTWRKNFISQFPACDVKPAFANEISIMIYHGIER